jgi:polysaccharide biosynthesis/export protein VpsN
MFFAPFQSHADEETHKQVLPPPYVMEGNSGPENTAPPSNDPYRLNAGDHLRIYVFGVPDLTGEFQVDRKGMITMPLIGEIQAEGMNKIELQKKITQMLMAGQYFNDPKVTVEIIALQPFYILGEVNTPGSYPYVADLDVFKAIAIAGGYTPRAAKDKIIIIRKVHEDKVKINADEDTPILPGDSIKVEQRFF